MKGGDPILYIDRNEIPENHRVLFPRQFGRIYDNIENSFDVTFSLTNNPNQRIDGIDDENAAHFHEIYMVCICEESGYIKIIRWIITFLQKQYGRLMLQRYKYSNTNRANADLFDTLHTEIANTEYPGVFEETHIVVDTPKTVETVNTMETFVLPYVDGNVNVARDKVREFLINVVTLFDPIVTEHHLK